MTKFVDELKGFGGFLWGLKLGSNGGLFDSSSRGCINGFLRGEGGFFFKGIFQGYLGIFWGCIENVVSILKKPISVV